MRKFKDMCDSCMDNREDVHSYFDSEGNVYLLCPECVKKNKSIVRNWKGEEITHEDESSKKKRTKQSKGKNNKNSSNTENGSKDSGQLLHGRVSRRKRDTEQPEHRPGRRKKTLI